MIENTARYAPCAGCNVGMGHHEPCDEVGAAPQTILNRTHCIAAGAVVECSACGLENAMCPSRPVGPAILACTPTPHGSVHRYTGGGDGLVEILENGGYGALYDGSADRVLVGGYGYRHGGNVHTQRVIIEPAEHTTKFDIRVAAAEVVNVTKYTTVFGAAYERAVFRPSKSSRVLKVTGIVVAACVVALLVVAHVYLTWQRALVYVSGEDEQVYQQYGGGDRGLLTGAFPDGSIVTFVTRGSTRLREGSVVDDRVYFLDKTGRR